MKKFDDRCAPPQKDVFSDRLQTPSFWRSTCLHANIGRVVFFQMKHLLVVSKLFAKDGRLVGLK